MDDPAEVGDELAHLREVGFKFDRWLDIVLMQKTLGAGDTTPPESGGTSA